MGVVGFVKAAGLGLALAVVAAVPGTMAQGGLAAYQGAWLAGARIVRRFIRPVGREHRSRNPLISSRPLSSSPAVA